MYAYHFGNVYSSGLNDLGTSIVMMVVVGGLCWLFNAYKLGKLKAAWSAVTGSFYGKLLLALFCALLCALAVHLLA